ncbi:MAG: hypothetical protein JJU23_06200 [Cyclobacteriaceae bacterium]|nr:hypothetical protein [Cyclobacteriaceae bacterium]
MRTFIFAMLFFLCTMKAWAQENSLNDNVRLGERHGLRYSTGFQDLIYLSNDGMNFYALQRPYRAVRNDIIGGLKTFHFARFSINDLELIENYPIDLSHEGDTRVFEFVATVKDQMYVFSSFLNRNTQTVSLFAERINRDLLSLSGNLQLVTSIDYSQISRFRRRYHFDHSISADGTKIVISYELRNRRGNTLASGIRLVDDQFNELLRFEEQVPVVGNEFFRPHDLIATNEGDLLILGKMYPNRKAHENTTQLKRRDIYSRIRIEWRYPNYHYQAYHIKTNGEINAYSFKDLDYFISDLVITPHTDGTLKMAGLYANKRSIDVRGIFSGDLNLNSQLLQNLKYNDLDFDFISLGLSENQKRRLERTYNRNRDRSRTYYELDDIVFYKDGGFALVTQPFLKDFNKGRFAEPSEYRFEYRDIWVIKHDKDGNIDWTTKVFKRQFYEDYNHEYLSYAMSFDNETLRFSYNQSEQSMLFNFGNPRRSELYYTTVDNEGKQNTQHLHTGSPLSGAFIARSAKHLKSGEIIYDNILLTGFQFLLLRR